MQLKALKGRVLNVTRNPIQVGEQVIQALEMQTANGLVRLSHVQISAFLATDVKMGSHLEILYCEYANTLWVQAVRLSCGEIISDVIVPRNRRLGPGLFGLALVTVIGLPLYGTYLLTSNWTFKHKVAQFIGTQWN